VKNGPRGTMHPLHLRRDTCQCGGPSLFYVSGVFARTFLELQQINPLAGFILVCDVTTRVRRKSAGRANSLETRSFLFIFWKLA
jgi:hypothetical protein